MEKKEEIFKDAPITHRGKFRCKKCNGWRPIYEARTIIVAQRNRPLEFEHISFTTKADITICQKCYEEMKKA